MLNTKNFKKLSQDQKESTYGGFAWLIGMFFASQIAAQLTSTVKMALSDSGSYKQKDFESHWDNDTKASATTKSSSETKITNVYYAY